MPTGKSAGKRGKANEPIPVVSASAVGRTPVHPDISEAKIDRMVETFYAQIREHQRLGPLFEGRLAGKWPQHLATMKAFWRSVLLKTGSYKGKPVPAHMRLKTIAPTDFGEWLELFRPVARDVFGPEAAREVILVAERIAQSLWFACFGFAGSEPPAGLFLTGRERSA